MRDSQFAAAVLAWFDRHGRKDLPWQLGRDPYRVWVSEIMLQQTQVQTVIPYYGRFMARFPEVATLAQASVDEVIALWAGLGYYARARHLHRAAHAVMERHGGAFPPDLEALQALPGIGRSTAGAILSLGMGLRAPILDGNVKRVLCRHAGLAGWPGESRIERALWRLAERHTPDERAGDYNQAMMDLGALVCVKRHPLCDACPVQAGCVARREGLTETIPAPKPRPAQPVRRCLMLVLQNGRGEVWLEQRPPAGIWGGLWSLPEFDAEDELRAWCAARGIDASLAERLPERRHVFSHFRLDFVPVVIRADPPVRAVADAGGPGWFRPEQAEGLPAPVKRVLRDIGEAASAEDGGQLSLGL